MCPILNGYVVMIAWSLEYNVKYNWKDMKNNKYAHYIVNLKSKYKWTSLNFL
jgi:hypothetical protein